MTRGPLYGAVEAGGTKFVCAVADAKGEIVALERLPTESPEPTLAAVCQFLKSAGERHGRLEAIGIASFGPVHLDRKSARYGQIGKTPKAGWTHTTSPG
jgi:fructokinase